MTENTRYLKSVQSIVDEAISIYQDAVSITNMNKIPDTQQIPIENPRQWLKIPDVICIFADMKGSTQLSASRHQNSTAKAYQLYTGTAVRIFNDFDPPYIDVRGDGVLALFNADQPHRALAAAVSFKTFASQHFGRLVNKDNDLDVGSHIAIDVKPVLVRRMGLKVRDGRTDRQNEVWAGRPVNMAAKLAGMTEDDELIVSDRYFRMLKNDAALKSCGCNFGGSGGEPLSLWDDKDLEDDDRFDFNKGKSLKTTWCSIHGREFCTKLLDADA